MDIEHVRDVEARHDAAQAVVDAARVALEPIAAALKRVQEQLFEAQRALEPIAQERRYLVMQARMDDNARGSRHALSLPRAIFNLPPPGTQGLPDGSDQDVKPRRSFHDAEALRAACAKVWLDPSSTTRFGLNDDYVMVGTSDPTALRALQEHVYATFPQASYRALVKQFAQREVVRD